MPFTPSWKKYEKDLHNPDKEVADKASDAFYLERQNELKNDPAARRWEKSRKDSAAKEKPEWVKQRIQREQEEIARPFKEFKNGGRFMKQIRPVPGFILVKPISRDEQQLRSGIYVPGQVEGMPNTGKVVCVSNDKLHENGVVELCPCKVGDEIMYKFGAGLDVVEKGDELKFMGFGDVLAILED